MRMTPLERDEDREAGEREEQESDRNSGFGDTVCGERQPEEKARNEDRECREAAPIDWCAALEFPDFPEAEVGPRGPEDPDRHIDVEEGSPVQEREDDPADREPRHGAHPEGDLIDPA